ncbi:MAG: rubredoxin [Christensenellales bacterium]|jgi:rubredoxin|nr:rubredoxin [Clostridium sp. CAG:465]
MAIYKFPICGYEYDEEKTGVKFEDLPDDYKCEILYSTKKYI